MSSAAKRLEADRPELFEVPMGDTRRVGSGYELRIAAFTVVVYENGEGGWHWGVLFGHGLVGSESDELAPYRTARDAAGVLETNLRRLQADLAEMVKQ
jgi:hypothetical protein